MYLPRPDDLQEEEGRRGKRSRRRQLLLNTRERWICIRNTPRAVKHYKLFIIRKGKIVCGKLDSSKTRTRKKKMKSVHIHMCFLAFV